MPGSDLRRKLSPLCNQAIISTCRESILLFCTFEMPAAQVDQTLLQTVLGLLSFALRQVDASLLTLLIIGRPQLHAIASRTIGSTLMFPLTVEFERLCTAAGMAAHEWQVDTSLIKGNALHFATRSGNACAYCLYV